MATEKKPFDASDPEQVKERKSASQLREARRLNGLRIILSQPDSRLWLHTLLGVCGTWNTPFDPNPYVAYTKMGEQNVGLRITADLTSRFKEEYIQLLKEGDER